MSRLRPNPWGARTLGGVPQPMIHVGCTRCPRRGRYQRAVLIERYGPDTDLEVLLAGLAGACARDGACGAHYVETSPWDPSRPTVTVARLARELRQHDPSMPVVVTGRNLGNVRLLRIACIGERPRRLYTYGRPHLLICADD